MKNKLLILAVILCFNLVGAIAQVTKVEIMATGLTCSMCSNAINKQLKALTVVDSVITDLNTNTFIVYAKEDAGLIPKSLKDRVEKAGFFVGSMIVTMNIENGKVPDTGEFQGERISFSVLENKSSESGNEKRFKIVDKGYVTQKEFKKFSKAYAKFPSFKNAVENVYNVIII